NQAISDNQLTDDEKQKIGEVLTNFANSIPEQQNAIDQLVSFLTKLQENAGNTKLQNIIDALNNAKPVLSILQERVTALNQAIQSGNIDDVKTLLGQVQDAAKNVNSLVSVIDPAQASSTVESILNQVISTIETAQGALSKADQIDFDSLLSSTKATVTNAVAILEKYQKEMPAIGQEIHDANTMLNGNMAAIVDG